MDPHVWSFGASSRRSFMDIGIYDLLSAPTQNVTIQSFQAPFGRKCFNSTDDEHDIEGSDTPSSPNKCVMSVNIGFALKLGPNTITVGGDSSFVVDGEAFAPSDSDSDSTSRNYNYSRPGGSYDLSWGSGSSYGNYSYSWTSYDYVYSSTEEKKDYSSTHGPVVTVYTRSYSLSAYNSSGSGSYQYSGMSSPSTYSWNYSSPAWEWSYTSYYITYNGLEVRMYGGWRSRYLATPNKMQSIYIKDTTRSRDVIAASTSGICLGDSNVTSWRNSSTLAAAPAATNVFDPTVLSTMLTTNGWESDGTVNTSWTDSPVHKYFTDNGLSLRRGVLRVANQPTQRRATDTHTVCSDNGVSYETALSKCSVAGRVFGMFESCVEDYCASGGLEEMITAYSEEGLEAAVEADDLGDQPNLATSQVHASDDLDTWIWVVIVACIGLACIVAGLATGFFVAKKQYEEVPLSSQIDLPVKTGM